MENANGKANAINLSFGEQVKQKKTAILKQNRISKSGIQMDSANTEVTYHPFWGMLQNVFFLALGYPVGITDPDPQLVPLGL